jgi:hypothetical protein
MPENEGIEDACAELTKKTFSPHSADAGRAESAGDSNVTGTHHQDEDIRRQRDVDSRRADQRALKALGLKSFRACERRFEPALRSGNISRQTVWRFWQEYRLAPRTVQVIEDVLQLPFCQLEKTLMQETQTPVEVYIEYSPETNPARFPEEFRRLAVDYCTRRGILAGLIANAGWPLVRCCLCGRLVAFDQAGITQEDCMAEEDDPVAPYCEWGCARVHQESMRNELGDEAYGMWSTEYYIQPLLEQLPRGGDYQGPVGPGSLCEQYDDP